MPRWGTTSTGHSTRAVPAPYPLFPASTAPPLALQETARCLRGAGAGHRPPPRCHARHQTPPHPHAAAAAAAAISPCSLLRGFRGAPWEI